MNKTGGGGLTTYVLELTSQTWRTATDVDRPVWKHWLTITRPAKVTSDKALLFIGGGANTDPAPTKSADRSTRIATETGTIVADLGTFYSCARERTFTRQPSAPTQHVK